MMVIDPKTGKKASFGTKKTIIEAYKKEKIEKKNVFNSKNNNILKNSNILRFY